VPAHPHAPHAGNTQVHMCECARACVCACVFRFVRVSWYTHDADEALRRSIKHASAMHTQTY